MGPPKLADSLAGDQLRAVAGLQGAKGCRAGSLAAQRARFLRSKGQKAKEPTFLGVSSFIRQLSWSAVWTYQMIRTLCTRSISMKTICYVDGFNLFHAIKELDCPPIKWLDLWTLAQSLCDPQKDELAGVVYFTAIADWEKDKALRHRKYIAALQSRGVEVVRSRFQKVTRSCKKNVCNCPFHEEKETDVALATRALSDALTGVAEKQIIITADTDQTPLLKAIKTLRPNVYTLIASTEERLKRANSLTGNCTRYKALHLQRFQACLLPRTVKNEAGKVIAECPARYLGS